MRVTIGTYCIFVKRGIVHGVLACLVALVGLSPIALAQPPPLKRIDLQQMRTRITPPPSEFEEGTGVIVASADEIAAADTYTIGEPTDDEQLYLEYINRARAAPQAEAQIHFATTDPGVLFAYGAWHVDLNLMVSQFASLTVKPPLSFDGRLITAARRHTNDMFNNNFQTHTGSDGSTAATRVTQSGYAFSNVAENIYASSLSTYFGHAGFEVNWGNGTGGMQVPPSHRNAIHSVFQQYREIGIGVKNDVAKGIYGPQWVTEVFASRTDALPMVTGVAYYDVDGNGAYSVGEGIGGLQVDSPSTTYTTVTSNSGGYSLPFATNGTYNVSFQGLGFAASTSSVTIANNNNVKLDFRPTYNAPTITGPASVNVGSLNSYSFNALAGASAYKWRIQRSSPSTRIEGAENGLADFTSGVNPVYSPIAGAPNVYQGTHSFHMAFDTAATDPFSITNPQVLTWNRPFRVTSTSALRFYSCQRWASPDQRATVWIKIDDGAYAKLNWEQRGTGAVDSCTFELQTLSLSAYAGKQLSFLFKYDLAGQEYYQGSNGIGWYFDNLEVTNAGELTGEQIFDIPSGTSFQYTPPSAGSFLLQVAGIVGNRRLDWGTFFALTVNAALPVPGAPQGVGVF